MSLITGPSPPTQKNKIKSKLRIILAVTTSPSQPQQLSVVHIDKNTFLFHLLLQVNSAFITDQSISQN
jgi:hypothetical protein